MAFMTHDEYLKTFGNALGAKASTPGIAPGPGQPPELAPAFQATQAPAPQEAYPGVSEQAMPAMGPPRPSEGPLQHKPLQEAAFGPAPQPQPAVPAAMAPPPQGGVTQPSPVVGAFQTAPPEEKGKGAGLTMRKLYDDSSEEEREQNAVEMEAQVPDVIAAAEAAAKQDPEGASKWDSFLSKRGWNRQEASAWLMEFGLKMMQAGGSGEGNFLSDVGSSALGATESRRAFRTAEEERLDRERQREMEDTEFDWKKEDRPGEVKETAAERTRREAKEMREQSAEARSQEAHEKAQNRGDWVKVINDKEEIVYQDPNTGKEWNTGVKATSRDADRRASAFMEKRDAWRETAAGLNNTTWEELSPRQRSLIDDAYFQYEKTGVNSKAIREKFIGDYVIAAVSPEVLGAAGKNPEVKSAAEAAAIKAAKALAGDIYGAEEKAPGGIPVFGKTPPPGSTPQEIADFYINPEG